MYMDDSRANLMMIGFVAFLIFMYVVFPHIFTSFFEKISDSRHDAKLRAEGNGQAFMQSGRLADRYAGLISSGYFQMPASSAGFSETAAPESSLTPSSVEMNYCPYCGADISALEADDMFCTNCGNRIR